MEPTKYFPKYYEKDIEIFYQYNDAADELPTVGCNKGLWSVFRSGLFSKVSHPTDFVCCLYCLNLLHQGIYNYLPGLYDKWCKVSAPFLNVQPSCGASCSIHLPIQLLHQLNLNYKNIDDSYRSCSSQQLSKYTQYFLYEYLKIITNSITKSVNLAVKLSEDSDCDEVRRYLELDPKHGKLTMDEHAKLSRRLVKTPIRNNREKYQHQKRQERFVLTAYLLKKSPHERLEYIATDIERSIYFYPEFLVEIDDYDLSMLNVEVRENLSFRLSNPPRKSQWKILSKQLLSSFNDERNYAYRKLKYKVDNIRTLPIKEWKAYINWLVKQNKLNLDNKTDRQKIMEEILNIIMS
ncbi:MAG: hypothetical protein N0E44_12670 [Candidatus Thiodiazotropha lotti]|nr:hypothetical protein [Candidatus Thiodiazotropha lotti]MCW4220741.1 hypothetical protein [Candidatus Thiodiazotropha lotti]